MRPKQAHSISSLTVGCIQLMPPPTSNRAQSMVRMTMADMAELADKRPGSFRLENADSDLPPPSHAVQATRDAIGVDRYNSYLPLHGLPELRQAISERYRADLGLRYDPDGEIVVTSGIGEAMLDVLLSYVNEGDRVLMTNPTYNGMAQRVRLAGGVQVFTNQLEANGWHLNPSELRRAAKGCKVIFYGSPSMPTGVVLTTRFLPTFRGLSRSLFSICITAQASLTRGLPTSRGLRSSLR